jgi:hypothetical protein
MLFRKYLLIAAVVSLPGQAAAQRLGDAAPPLRGIVVEQGETAPVVGAVVRLLDENFVPVASVTTDAEGAFAFPAVRPGRYTMQAADRDLVSALSEEIEVIAGSESQSIVLTLPSPLIRSANDCASGQLPGNGTLIGVVRDEDMAVALPGARITLRWQDGTATLSLETTTDGGGRYHFCSVPLRTSVTARIEAYGRGVSESSFMIASSALSRQDFAVGLFTRASGRQIDGLRRGGEADPGTITGVLHDSDTGQPVSGALLSLVGTSLQQLTDIQGRFRFTGLTPREYTLHVQHLGYGRQSEALEISGGSDITLNLFLTPRAIVLEGVTVQARSALASARRASPTAFRAIAGDEMRLLELRGARVADALRERVTGLVIAEGTFETPEGLSPICIEWSRRNMTIETGGSGQFPFCDMVVLYIDDARISNPGDVLRGLQLTDFESIQLLSPLEAGTRFGLDAARGVLLLHTRGRGPYTDSRRN